nr:hypothetical protein [uncultured Acetatifactor sp.]
MGERENPSRPPSEYPHIYVERTETGNYWLYRWDRDGEGALLEIILHLYQKRISL